MGGAASSRRGPTLEEEREKAEKTKNVADVKSQELRQRLLELEGAKEAASRALALVEELQPQVSSGRRLLARSQHANGATCVPARRWPLPAP